MAAMTKYHGLCETCDRDAACTLKRSSRLEIIHCEQYSTQPLIRKQDSARLEIAPSEVTRNHGLETCADESASLTDQA
jgi:hypothetical protein